MESLTPGYFALVMASGIVSVGMDLQGHDVLSAVLLGGMVAFAVRPPLWVAGLLVAVFAVFHGHAHGT